MDINNFVSGVTTNISNQTAPKSIPSTVVGQALVDLANLTKTSLDQKLDITGSTVFLTGITKNQVTTALNYTPLSGSTTLAGYGISSADTIFNNRFISGSTTLAGYGISSADTIFNGRFISGSTTLSGYGISSGDTILAAYTPLSSIGYTTTSTYGAQLFDKNNFLQDCSISNTGGVFFYPPTSSSLSGRTARIFLPDSGQTQLKATGFQHLNSSSYRWCFHNAADTLIAGAFGNVSAESVSVLNIPSGATYWYITYKHPTLDDNTAGDNLMVNYGSSAMTYQPYSAATINKTLTSVAGAVVKTISDSDLLAYAKKTYVNAFMPYAGLKLATLGDSITRGLTWQQPLADLTGMIFNSDWVTDATKPLGIGGSRITPAIATGVTGQEATQSIYYRADYVSGYSPDVIILFGGQNDSRLTGYTLTDAPYTGGELVTGDPAMPSFVSAYKGTLVKLLSQNPYAKVVAMTPMYNGSVISAYTSSIWASYKLRNDTIKAICEMYSVQFVDLMGLVGITPYNAALLYGDASIHPNALGGVRMARLIAGVLQ